jgi:hypothetical protein
MTNRRDDRKPLWPVAALFIALLGACTLPGHSGWECDGDGDCSAGLRCRSVQGDRGGYSSVCLAPGETVVVGGKGNWLRLLMWPAIGLTLGSALIIRVVARKRDAERIERRRRWRS